MGSSEPGTSQLSSDHADDYQRHMRIGRPPEDVFRALTTIPGLARWWTSVTGSAGEGGELRFTFGHGDPLVIRVVTARRPSWVLWAVSECGFLPEWPGTSVRFLLAPSPGGACDVTVRHVGLTSDLACFTSCREGWDHYLASLAGYLETGRGSPFEPDHKNGG